MLERCRRERKDDRMEIGIQERLKEILAGDRSREEWMKEFEREKNERKNWERGTDVRVNERERKRKRKVKMES